MNNKLIQTQWGVFSANFVKFHALPFGAELRLFDQHGRKKRSDFLVKRKRVSAKTMKKASGEENVRSLLDTALALMSTDLKARRLTLGLCDPTGKLVSGNKLISTVRQIEPKLTTDDVERLAAEQSFITEAQSSARASIIESEYLIDDPEVTVCAGYIRALVARYGRQAVLAALAQC